MPLNKLENFIKNTEGRILYVNPNDLDATDGIENEGNSLTKPFKTIQRALIESARFSYIEGNDNDIVEKTTILCFPGEHLIDNRPGHGIKTVSGDARAVPAESVNGAPLNEGATETFGLTLDSNFDLTQKDNVLYRFNSVHGGVVIPRGTSLVGLDLRKTKIRPKYVPNPTDPDVPESSIFKITGTCYFWQFTLFDGDENTTVYTDNHDFGLTNRSKPTFSHHKLTCFEYADGVNVIGDYGLTDLQVYYSKLSNAFNRASTREVRFKFPTHPDDFAPVRPEFEIVGAFATDPLSISNIISGDGATAGNIVTVTTALPHNFSSGTPIKIKGVSALDYNISTKVKTVISDTKFTYLLPFVRSTLPAGPSSGLGFGDAEVLVETDTVTGASPYIFNCSLRSVWGMQGMHADGNKATGFKSMVVAQFTGVSLQKDDRAFVKFNKTSREYVGLTPSVQRGEILASKSSSTNIDQVYHLDSGCVYRPEYETTHVKVSNDAVIQIVSVFAIGYHTHFNMLSGADASVTNSNSNFGQFALCADGFKKEAFDKDNKGFVTSIVTPRAIVTREDAIDWLQIDKTATTQILNSPNNTAPFPGRLYLLGNKNKFSPPSAIAQGFRIGAKVGEKLYLAGATPYEASVVMSNGALTATTNTSEKSYTALHSNPVTNVNPAKYTISTGHNLANGESIRIISDSGKLPQGLDAHKVYYAITSDASNSGLGNNEIRIASSRANAELTNPEFIRTSFTEAEGTVNIISRVSDKNPGDLGHPVQFDEGTYSITRGIAGAQTTTTESGGWFVHIDTTGDTITPVIKDNTFTDDDNVPIPYILRRTDDRSLDEKLYKVRYVIPKEIKGAKDPTDGFILQESSSTGAVANTDFTIPNDPTGTLTVNDYEFQKNPKFITTISYDNNTKIATVRSDKSHGLKVGNRVTIKHVTTSSNPTGVFDKEFNGNFIVDSVDNDRIFKYKVVKLVDSYSPTGDDIVVGTITVNDGDGTHVRSLTLPRFERNDTRENLYVYRSEVITSYEEGIQDGIYHLFVLNGNNSADGVFAFKKYNQSITDLYPQHDRDNPEDNPQEAKTYAKLEPIGSVVTNDLKKSITRETSNIFLSTFGVSNVITSANNSANSTSIALDGSHGLNGIRFYDEDVTGTGTFTNSTPNVPYQNIKLFDDISQPSTANWKGATCSVEVTSAGVVQNTGQVLRDTIKIQEGGAGYKVGDTLYFDSSEIGGLKGTPSQYITLEAKHIASVTNNYVQVTGITTATDGYFMINEVSGDKSITVHKSSADTIYAGQQVIDMGPAAEVSSSTAPTESGSGLTKSTTFTTTKAHGMLKGNKFRILSATYENLGDFVVEEETAYNVFSATTGETTGLVANAKYILKHGLSAHDAVSGRSAENLGVRTLSLGDHDVMIADELVAASVSEFKVNLYDEPTFNTAVQESIQAKFPIGSYIQIDDEIMRVNKTVLGGTSNNKLSVIRGVLGSNIQEHKNKSLISKIKPIAMEVRRPSILRASGHTFEYLGYGPGNYSTGLPQISDRTLTEREEFLAQSQETSCGTVVYTGMNDKGDFYIGNTKISADSGQQTTFDIPIPTVTGEDPSKLSVVFDEVIIKERLLVEGGSSKQILSQFNGPVTFNGISRFNNLLQSQTIKVGTSHTVYINNDDEESESNYDDIVCGSTYKGALQVKGGATFGKNLNICGKLGVKNDEQSTNINSGAVRVAGGVGIGKNLNVGGGGSYAGNVLFSGGSHFPSNKLVSFGGATVADKKGAIYHDSASSNDNLRVVATDDNTHLYLQSNNKVIIGNKDNSAQGLTYTRSNGSVKLYYGGTATHKLQTTTDGVQIEGRLDVSGDIIAFASASDHRLKDNITPIQNPLEKILSISGNTFNWNAESDWEGKADTGLIAQEIEGLGLPGVAEIRGDGIHGVHYEKVIPLLVEAVKELTKRIEGLEHDLRFKK